MTRRATGVAALVAEPDDFLRRTATDLQTLGARWALVGALAVAVRSEPRFTRDVDVAVAADSDEAAERLVSAARELGYRIVSDVEHEPSGRLAMVRLVRSEEAADAVVDLLFASSGIEPEIVDEAEDLEALPGLRVPVATTGHLIALKLLASGDDRPQDLVDLRMLLSVASDADVGVARSAIGLIRARGFDRGRDLSGDLRDAVARWR